MPMSRHEIRNEYSLADPELHRAADKDDPVALLEGVAMAGLVGVLRQLGDLAEFAAEIFHNLHEEVMATSARGHSLMIRVQQLETEVPSIEKAFLSQTNHSSFFYHAGVDWHPSQRMDQNLVTQGDLPRFIMDSYEECRAPPHLFLLDKFDVAGAGACLKRYTDPSFFKVEISGMTSADVQRRQKKILKPKKKGLRRRNGEAPGIIPTSHTKLHQLLREERAENGVTNPSCRVKLKRRLNGFPFELKTGKSYMEKILKSPSPDHKVLREVNLNSSSPQALARSDQNELGLEVLEVRPASPATETVGGEQSLPPSPDGKEILPNPSICEHTEVPANDKIGVLPNSYRSLATDDMPSVLDKVTDEKVIAVDAVNSIMSCLTGYVSDGISSEAENYVDATSTVDSEIDIENELRTKNDYTSRQIKSQPLISDADGKHRPTRSLDSQSTGDSTIYDDEDNSSRKEMSICSSADSSSICAESSQSEKFAERFPFSDPNGNEIVDALSCQKKVDEGFSVDQYSKTVACDDTCTAEDAINNHRSHFEQLTSTLCSNESMPSSVHSESEGIVTKSLLRQSESDKVAITWDVDEKKTNLAIDQPSDLIVSNFELQSGDYSARTSAREQLVNKPNCNTVPHLPTTPDINCHTTDSSAAPPLDLLREDEPNREDQKQVENKASALNAFRVLSQNRKGAPEMMFSRNPIPGELDDKFPKLLENIPSNHPDTAHNEYTTYSTVFQGERLIDKLDNEDSNVSTDALSSSSGMMEASLGKKLSETLMANAETVEAVENRLNSSNENLLHSANLISSHLANSSDWLRAGHDADEKDIIPEQETTVNELENDKDCLSGCCREVELDVSAPMFSLVNCPNPPSASQLPRLSNDDISVSGYPEHLSGSISSPGDPFSEANQVNLDDPRPLPPLPPAQWRMGKFQQASSSTEGEMKKHKDLFSQPISAVIVSPDDVSSSTLNTSTNDVGSSPSTTSIGNVSSSPLTTSTDNVSLSLEEFTHPKGASKEKEVQFSSSSFEVKDLNENIDLVPNIEDKQQQFAMPTPRSELTLPDEEVGVAHSSRTVKLPRPRNPLIKDVSDLDKSKLRKVTDRDKPPIPKVDERESLLEQIRTKSFILKPAKAPRPSFQCPKTNLKVTALLQKANSIRQAVTDSDEDDDDSWSDS